MGKGRRKRGQRTFNPNERAGEKIGDKLVEHFDRVWNDLQDLTRRKALGRFAQRLDNDDKEETVGEAMLVSIAEALGDTASQLQRDVKRFEDKRIREQEAQKMKHAKDKKILEISEQAASAAFPGVEEGE